jgi:hypothetical protein
MILQKITIPTYVVFFHEYYWISNAYIFPNIYMLHETSANIIDLVDRHRRYSAILSLSTLQAFTSSIVTSCLL